MCTFATDNIFTNLKIMTMANNPYLSRLKKIAKENDKLEAFDRILAERPNADPKSVFVEIGLELPTMGAKKLTDEEKQAKQADNESKLLDIYRNGTANEKKAIDNIIADHENNIEIVEQQKKLKEAKTALTKLKVSDDQIKKLLSIE